MPFADALFRQGHLSEQALVEALMTGERPGHLDKCDLCAQRAAELGRWLDELRVAGHETADQVFTADRLAAQHAQIMRKIEQADEPPRVISFPAASARDARETVARRVAPAWVGVAAAAGLVLGVVGGQLSARLTIQPVTITVQQPPANPAAAPLPDAVGPEIAESSSTVPAASVTLDEHLLLNSTGPLDFIDEITPRLSANLPNRSGG